MKTDVIIGKKYKEVLYESFYPKLSPQPNSETAKKTQYRKYDFLFHSMTADSYTHHSNGNSISLTEFTTKSGLNAYFFNSSFLLIPDSTNIVRYPICTPP
ncbi:hypothetical protein SAMN04488109_2900 [Chryseolinea serpens]|uniref:Uncharacterized protein n=1 Tax=Chryseolinea serpens TaxID=947013 RepID=A0A1M5QML1_9BACT|nr:hypothetical protein SAMN04488109_2900 [Chryseolinea serpens]